MPSVEKLSIALTPEMASAVREAVDTGEYASSSEVIREALRDWQRKRSLQRQEIEEIRRLWNEGIVSGPSHHADMAAIRAEAQRRLHQDRNQD